MKTKYVFLMEQMDLDENLMKAVLDGFSDK